MTTDEISLMAYKNERPGVQDMSIPEWLLWYRLRDAYREYANQPEEGAKQKQIWIAQYIRDRNDWVRTKEVHAHMAAQWKRIEEPAKKFVRDRTVESGIAFLESVYMVPVKDQIKYWGEE